MLPNRILNQSICTSDSMAGLNWFEQILFIRLIVSVDDYGRYDARPAIIKGTLFPLDDVTTKSVEAALQTLSTHGMISLYCVAEKPYLELTAWLKFNVPRAKESKYPAPNKNGCEHMQAGESKCEHMQADVPDIRIRNSYSDSVSDIRDSDDCAEPDAPASPPVITLPLNDKTEYPISQEQCQEWAGLYPAVDVMQQLRNMRGWLMANPERRKTKRGISRFINTWLSKEQDKGKKPGIGNAQKPSQGRKGTGDQLLDMINSGVFDE